MARHFKIGSISVNGNIILAPMDGISDQPFRWLCRRMGSAFIVSEFINVLDVTGALKDFQKRICFTESERPFGYQLYGNDQGQILDAVRKLSKKNPDFFDLNLGCAVRRIAGRGAGAGLLQVPEKIKGIISSMVRSSPIPITIKMRLGWDQSSKNFLEIARIAEGEGVSMISIHGRTKSDTWADPADWEAIKSLKKHVQIPVIGNGDIRTAADIDRMLRSTGCDGVMVGRAVIGNPWLMAGLDKMDLSAEQIKKTIFLHWTLMQSFYGRDRARILFKKHLKAYLDCPQFSDLNIKQIIKSKNPIRHLYY